MIGPGPGAEAAKKSPALHDRVVTKALSRVKKPAAHRVLALFPGALVARFSWLGAGKSSRQQINFTHLAALQFPPSPGFINGFSFLPDHVVTPNARRSIFWRVVSDENKSGGNCQAMRF